MVDRVSRRSLSAPSQMFTHTLFKAKLRSYKSRNIHDFFSYETTLKHTHDERETDGAADYKDLWIY